MDFFTQVSNLILQSTALFFCLFFGQTANWPPVGSEETPRIGETRYDGLAKKTNQALAFTGYRLCKNR